VAGRDYTDGPGRSRGAEILEWIVVTFLLTIATFAILQAVGGELTILVDAVVGWGRAVLGL
jgi:hypothetical protein